MGTPARRLPHVSARRLRLVRGLLALLQAASPRLAARVGLRLFLTPARRKLDPADEAAMYAARQHFLRCANGDPVRAYEWGEGTRTVAIVHGWGSHAARFATMARSLTARGWRVVAFDAPGHGESPGATSSLPQFIGALDAVLEALGPAQALVGHSMGSLAIAMRLGTGPALPSVHRVVLVSMPTGVPFLVDSFHSLFGIGAAPQREGQALFQRRFGGPPEQFTAMSGPALPDLPVLLVHDEADDVVPIDHSRELLARLPRAELLATRGLGHSGPLRDPATLAAIGDFLDRP